MVPETASGLLLGGGVAGAAGVCGFAWLARARRKAGRIEPVGFLQATALRFGLSLAGCLVLALTLDRARVPMAMAGLGATYFALLAFETRWALGGGWHGR
jgi:hypothetical protein